MVPRNYLIVTLTLPVNQLFYRQQETRLLQCENTRKIGRAKILIDTHIKTVNTPQVTFLCEILCRFCISHDEKYNFLNQLFYKQIKISSVTSLNSAKFAIWREIFDEKAWNVKNHPLLISIYLSPFTDNLILAQNPIVSI